MFGGSYCDRRPASFALFPKDVVASERISAVEGKAVVQNMKDLQSRLTASG
jgi:hypothetical protein